MENRIDWELWHAFLAVAEAGSLSAAARKAGVSQPTLGRQVRALEGALGIGLFRREPRGLALTEAGRDLLEPARAMRQAAARAELAAAGRETGLAGTVRITASRIVSAHLLPPILADLRADEPGIEIDLVPSDETENLLFREADIAVRMYRPTQQDIVTRHLGVFGMALYAAPALLERHGTPATLDALLSLPFVGFDRNDLILRMMADLGLQRRREDFGLRCDDQLVYLHLVRAGCGVGGMPRPVGDADTSLRRVAPFVALPSLPVWLAMPDALRANPRIRRVWDHLAGALAARLDQAAPAR